MKRTEADSLAPPAMFGHTAVFSGPVMWVFGGTSQREILNSLWSYDTGLFEINLRFPANILDYFEPILCFSMFISFISNFVKT